LWVSGNSWGPAVSPCFGRLTSRGRILTRYVCAQAAAEPGQRGRSSSRQTAKPSWRGGHPPSPSSRGRGTLSWFVPVPCPGFGRSSAGCPGVPCPGSGSGVPGTPVPAADAALFGCRVGAAMLPRGGKRKLNPVLLCGILSRFLPLTSSQFGSGSVVAGPWPVPLGGVRWLLLSRRLGCGSRGQGTAPVTRVLVRGALVAACRSWGCYSSK